MSRSIAFLGTGSDVGKSIISAGVGFLLAKRGYRVAPFKAQNMSNNSYVTRDGGEMGRAQVVQARACGVEPSTDMNPILLKPSSHTGSQIIVNGKLYKTVEAREYYNLTKVCSDYAFKSLHKLIEMYDILVIEGAGSCTEMNLRDRDFVNFATAIEANAAVILVADIERGGVFSQIIGTLELLSDREKSLVKGIIINKFRGDLSLFDSGVEYIQNRCNIPVLGVIPWMDNVPLEEEDSVAVFNKIDPITIIDEIYNIGIVVTPHVSNYTDFFPLENLNGVGVSYLSKPNSIDKFDALIIAGTKSVISDLRFLKERGWEAALHSFKGRVVGVCGGYQMLGSRIVDLEGVDGVVGTENGFNLLTAETTFLMDKVVNNSLGFSSLWGCKISGYQIHNGITTHNQEPFITISKEKYDGEIDSYKRVIGTYFHGLFESVDTVRALLNWIDPSRVSKIDFNNCQFESGINSVGKHLLDSLDFEKIISIIEEQD